MTLDPIRIAQFFALPGADRLVDAYSALPPGRLRDAAIEHVEAIAEAVGWRAPSMDIPAPPPPPKPNGHAALAQPAAPQIAGPRIDPEDERPSGGGQEQEVVRRLIGGDAPQKVAEDLGLRLGAVSRIRSEARTAGVIFPDNTKIERGAASVERAAAAKGLSVEEYGAWQLGIVERWMRGEKPVDIAAALGEDVKVIGNIISRREKIEARFGAAAPPHWAEADELPEGRAATAQMIAAERRGLTLEQYRHKVRRCMQMRVERLPADQIASVLGESRMWVYQLATAVQIDGLRRRQTASRTLSTQQEEAAHHG